MRTKQVIKKDGRGKDAKVIWQADFQFPETVDEWRTTKGDQWICRKLDDDLEIELRALNDPRKEGGIVSRSTLTDLRAGIVNGDFTEDDLKAFMASRKTA